MLCMYTYIGRCQIILELSDTAHVVNRYILHIHTLEVKISFLLAYIDYQNTLPSIHPYCTY